MFELRHRCVSVASLFLFYSCWNTYYSICPHGSHARLLPHSPGLCVLCHDKLINIETIQMSDNIYMHTLHDLLTLMHAIVDFPILCTVFLFHSLGIGDRVPNGEHIKIETTGKKRTHYFENCHKNICCAITITKSNTCIHAA